MEFFKYKDLKMPSELGYEHLLDIQYYLNTELSLLFRDLKGQSREKIARELVTKVESLTDCINEFGYDLHRCNYSGDVNYENSKQIYCNKSLNIRFHGFSAQISWDVW
ncbi:hypothetical protein ACFO4O_15315 [Glaciecola siphonariae]|uniref:Uncharacterized protein n=1 Tax=Glaciecola siphonariae TaxID=521012 RepID=A0ABV9LZF5_9ALTE